MKQLKVTIKSCFYKTTVSIGGWANASYWGPFHRHRAIKMCDECQLAAARMIAKERIKDEKNIEFIR